MMCALAASTVIHQKATPGAGSCPTTTLCAAPSLGPLLLPRYQGLCEWMRMRGATVHRAVHIAPDPLGHVVGLSARIRIEEGEMLLRVPFSATLNSTHIAHHTETYFAKVSECSLLNIRFEY